MSDWINSNGALLFIDDLEDYYLAEARARKNRKTIPLDDVERQLGLAR